MAGVCSVWWLDSSPVPTLSIRIAPATWRPSFRMPTTLFKVRYPLLTSYSLFIVQTCFNDPTNMSQVSIQSRGFCYKIWLESNLNLFVCTKNSRDCDCDCVHIIFVYRTGKCVCNKSQTITQFWRTQAHPFTLRDGGHFGKWRQWNVEQRMSMHVELFLYHNIWITCRLGGTLVGCPSCCLMEPNFPARFTDLV